MFTYKRCCFAPEAALFIIRKQPEFHSYRNKWNLNSTRTPNPYTSIWAMAVSWRNNSPPNAKVHEWSSKTVPFYKSLQRNNTCTLVQNWHCQNGFQQQMKSVVSFVRNAQCGTTHLISLPVDFRRHLNRRNANRVDANLYAGLLWQQKRSSNLVIMARQWILNAFSPTTRQLEQPK